jgi:hypothetical protein
MDNSAYVYDFETEIENQSEEQLLRRFLKFTFMMIIHKSQGQFLEIVGIYFKLRDCFLDPGQNIGTNCHTIIINNSLIQLKEISRSTYNFYSL